MGRLSRSLTAAAVLGLLLSGLPANSVGLLPAVKADTQVPSCKGGVTLGPNKYVAIALDRSGSYDLRTEWSNYKEYLGTYASALFGDASAKQGPITLKVYYIGNSDIPGTTVSAVKFGSPAFNGYWSKVCFPSFAKDNMVKSAEAAQAAIMQVVLDGDKGQACKDTFVQTYKSISRRHEPVNPNGANLQGFVCSQLDALRSKIESVKIGQMCPNDKPCSNILEALERAAGGVPSDGSKPVQKCVAVFSDGMNFDHGSKRDANPTNMYNLVLKKTTPADGMRLQGRTTAGHMGVNWGPGSLRIQLIGYGFPSDARLTNTQRNRLRAWWIGIAQQWGAALEVKDSSEVCQ